MTELDNARQVILRQLVSRIRADGYKVRMSLRQWWIDLHYKGEPLGYRIGPYGFHEAMQIGKTLGIKDLDKDGFLALNEKLEKLEAKRK